MNLFCNLNFLSTLTSLSCSFNINNLGYFMFLEIGQGFFVRLKEKTLNVIRTERLLLRIE